MCSRLANRTLADRFHELLFALPDDDGMPALTQSAAWVEYDRVHGDSAD